MEIASLSGRRTVGTDQIVVHDGSGPINECRRRRSGTWRLRQSGRLLVLLAFFVAVARGPIRRASRRNDGHANARKALKRCSPSSGPAPQASSLGSSVRGFPYINWTHLVWFWLNEAEGERFLAGKGSSRYGLAELSSMQ